MTYRIPDFEKKLRIDLDDLDQELIEQSEILWHIGRQRAALVSRADEMKLDIKHAEACFAHRRREEEDRISEAQIKREIEEDESIENYRRDLIKLTGEIGQWDAMLSSFRSRGFMLRDLVALHLARHYGSDSVSDARADELREGMRKTRVRIGKKKTKITTKKKKHR